MMEKDIFDRIHEIDFADLSQAERNECADLFSTEEEFDNLKAFLTKVDDNKAVFTPSNSAKSRLDDVFAETYPTENQKKGLMAFLWPQGVPIYRKPLFQVAAVLLLIFTAIPLVQNATKIENNEIAQVDQKEIERTVSEENKQEIEESNGVQSEEKEGVASNDIDVKSEVPERASQQASVMPIANEYAKEVNDDYSNIVNVGNGENQIKGKLSEIDHGLGFVGTDYNPTEEVSFAKLDSNHPDLHFEGVESDEVNMSVPSSNPNEEIFDLITAAF